MTRTDDQAGVLARLAALLAAENAALAAGMPERAGALLADKEQAIAALDHLPPGVAATAELRAAARRLAGLVAENRRLLARAIAVQGRVLDVLAQAAMPDALPGGPPGARANARPGVRAAPRTLSAQA
jgi:hypothetical protein